MSLFRLCKSNGRWMNTGIKTRYMYVISVFLKSYRPSKTSFHPDNKHKRTEIRITVNRFSTFCTQERTVRGGAIRRDLPIFRTSTNHRLLTPTRNQALTEELADIHSTDAVNMLTSKLGPSCSSLGLNDLAQTETLSTKLMHRISKDG